MARFSACLALLLGLLGGARDAQAFCRATTCDPSDPKQQCEEDRNRCVRTGESLFWPSSCVTFAVEANGSPKSGLDAGDVTDVVKQAFAAWTHADCDGDHPSIKVGSHGPVACDESRYNEAGKNANIVIFRDDVWPYQGSVDTFGLTLVRFDYDTGEILDADVEINSADFELTLDGAKDGVDLASILTHELGHFLGLSHSIDSSATMREGWDGAGTALRTLTSDDEAGICAIYPPDRTAGSSCEPRNGFSAECFVPLPAQTVKSAGCAGAARNPSPTGAATLAAALLGAFALRRGSRRTS